MPTKLVTTASGIEKNNFRSFIYGQSSTNHANFVNIGPVDVDIIALTEITKNIIKKLKNQQNISPLRLRFAQSGWANNEQSKQFTEMHFTMCFTLDEREDGCGAVDLVDDGECVFVKVVWFHFGNEQTQLVVPAANRRPTRPILLHCTRTCKPELN